MEVRRERSVITKHIRNVFKEGELDPAATCAKFAQVRAEGGRTVSREVEYFNLDPFLSVGYRINSRRGTQFRIWATRTLTSHVLITDEGHAVLGVVQQYTLEPSESRGWSVRNQPNH